MQVEVGTMAPTQKETDTLLPFDQTPSLVKNVETRINQINANKTPVQIESVTYPQNLQDKELQSINDHSLPDIKITYQ